MIGTAQVPPIRSGEGENSVIRRIRSACLIALIAAVPTVTAAQPGRHPGADGPVVLDTDPDTGLPVPIPFRTDLDPDRAVPVPSVMNGSGFGLTGTDYYSDGRHEGRLSGGVRTSTYVLAPALRAAPSR